MNKKCIALKEIGKYYPISYWGLRRIIAKTEQDIGARWLGGKIVIIPEIFDAWIENNKVNLGGHKE